MPDTSYVAGYTDGLSHDRMTLSGWLALDAAGEIPDVRCFQRSIEIGIVQIGDPRPDVTTAGIDNRSFHIHFEDPVPLGAMLTGEYTVRDIGTSLPLSPTVGFRTRCQEELLSLIDFSNPATRTSALPRIAEPIRPLSADDLSPIMFPVGMVSGDGLAQLGKNGCAFLVGGPTQLSQRYRKPKTPSTQAAFTETLEHCLSTYRTWAKELAALGILYRQIIVPEKSTVLPRLASLSRPITPLLEEIERRLSREQWYVSATQALRSMAEPERGWPKYDSHPAPAGMRSLVLALIDALDLTASSTTLAALDHTHFFQGDLSASLFGTHLWEPLATPKAHDDNPPLNLTVLVVDNAAPGHVDDPRALTWWLTQEFQEVHVSSASQLDLAEIREIRPDVVVYHTTERLLGADARSDATANPTEPHSQANSNVTSFVTGFVERVSRNRTSVTGWVSVSDDGALPNIRCFRRGVAVGNAAFGDARLDASASTGHNAVAFEIVLDHELPHGALLTGEYLVKDVYSGSALQLTVRLFKESEAELAALARIPKSLSSERIPATKPRSLADLSTVWFPVGLTSPDGSATVGKGGFAFLTGGSNAVSERYREPTKRVQRRALERSVDAWASLFHERRRTIEQLGARYVQIIVPEKTTTLHHLIDLEGPITPLLRDLEEQIGTESWYLSGRRVFESLDDPELAWLHYDGHPAPYGTQALMKALVARLELPESAVIAAEPTDVAFFEGDLSRRLFHVNLWDPHIAPANDETLDGGPLPDLIESYTPGVGKHVGSKRVWRRESASYNMKVMIFGDSTFGTGAHSAQLSWWASRAFREAHFIWSNTLDHDDVAAIQPDLVICQTIERFLGRRPEA